MTVTTDYLVKGCGATAMAFVDVMLRESDARFVIVDKRAAPGGHWNDAYPFVRLHQPSSCYGVASRALGHDRRDNDGLNKGYLELASGLEVANYFHQVMHDSFLPSGRVSYFPVSEVLADAPGSGRAEIVSLLSGERRAVSIARKFVDATMTSTSIPLTHKRQFEIAAGVSCAPPNDLARVAPGFGRFTVLGGGKTAIDCLLWLVSNGAAPDKLTWVAPRDAWLINRATMQPGLEYFEESIGGFATQYEIAATANSAREFCQRMEDAECWLRLDPAIWPTMCHGATVTTAELHELRRVRNIVRKGRVKRIEADRIVLDAGLARAEPDTLYVDCTARALAGNVNDRSPAFAPNLIRLQMIRAYQPTFSAALIGHIEASIADEAQKRLLTKVAPMSDTVKDYLLVLAETIANQRAWSKNEDLRAWVKTCRLDMFGKTVSQVTEHDAQKLAILGRLAATGRAAEENLRRLAQAA